MKDRDEQEGHRLAEIDQLSNLRVSQDRAGLPQVGQDDAGGAAAREQRVGVHVHDGVVVHVNDPRVRCGGLGYLVGVLGGRQPGADVQELADARLPGEVLDGAAQEGPVGTDSGHDGGGRPG
jgi:hypothetical protein